MDEKGGTLNVPYDIIRNIFIRLPVKSLLIFKAVSKICLNTIFDPVFVGAHLHQSKNSTRQILLIEEYPNEHGEAKLVEIENEKCQVESILKYPLRKYGPFFMLCYCDGLSIFRCTCRYRVRGDIERLFMLRNSSSRTFRLFWCPYELGDKALLSYGLCYDPSIEDYKFIVTDMREYHAVFYCRNNYWIERKELLLNGAFRARRKVIPTQGVCFNGVLYWLLHDYDQNRYEIVCFDPRNDKYRIMQKPKDSQRNTSNVWYLASLGGHLCLSHNVNIYNSMVQIFTLKKDGDQDTWVEFITIDLSSLPPFPHFAMPVFLTNENEIILLIGECLLVYNLHRKTFAQIQKKWNDICHPPLPYADNLFFSSGRNNHENTYWMDEMDINIHINDALGV